jgi:hypothetical protein
MLVDHATQLDQNYFRPNEEEVLSEYLKAEPYLTIDPTFRMSQEIQTLRIEKSEMDELKQQMAQFNEILNEYTENGRKITGK